MTLGQEINSIMLGNYPTYTIPWEESYYEFTKKYDELVKKYAKDYQQEGIYRRYNINPIYSGVFIDELDELMKEYVKCIHRRREQVESLLN